MVRGFDAQQISLINATDLKMNHSPFPSRDWVHHRRPHFGVTVVANPHRGHSTTSSLNPVLFVPQELKPLSLLGSRPVSQSVLYLLLPYCTCFHMVVAFGSHRLSFATVLASVTYLRRRTAARFRVL